MTSNLMKRLVALELATNGTPSPLYPLLIELSLANGKAIPTLDKSDTVAVISAFIELLPN